MATPRPAGGSGRSPGRWPWLAYVLVMIAVRRAPVGYVAALRESSVLLAAFLGNRYLAEGAVRRRTIAAASSSPASSSSSLAR